MSFILEALKKSEKKRQEGSAPKLETVLQPAAPARRAKPAWVWGLLALLVLNAAVLLWLFGPWALPQTPPLAQAPATPVPAQPTPAAVDREAVVPSPAPASAPFPQAAPASTPAAVPVIPVAPETQSPSLAQVRPEVEVEPAGSTSPVETASPASGWDTSPQEVLALEQLPRSIRGDLPQLHMSVHVFSPEDPAASMIRIDGQILRTGARLDNKYLLEEITADGAVFRYSGYRFLVPRQNLRKR